MIHTRLLAPVLASVFLGFAGGCVSRTPEVLHRSSPSTPRQSHSPMPFR